MKKEYKSKPLLRIRERGFGDLISFDEEQDLKAMAQERVGVQTKKIGQHACKLSLKELGYHTFSYYHIKRNQHFIIIMLLINYIMKLTPGINVREFFQQICVKTKQISLMAEAKSDIVHAEVQRLKALREQNRNNKEIQA